MGLQTKKLPLLRQLPLYARSMEFSKQNREFIELIIIITALTAWAGERKNREEGHYNFGYILF